MKGEDDIMGELKPLRIITGTDDDCKVSNRLTLKYRSEKMHNSVEIKRLGRTSLRGVILYNLSLSHFLPYTFRIISVISSTIVCISSFFTSSSPSDMI